MNRYNERYTELSLWALTDDIGAHLLAQMIEWEKYSWYKIRISPDDVIFEAFDADEMNTVRKTLTLLVVAISNFDDSKLLDRWIVELPNDWYLSWVSHEKGGDLFKEFPYTAKSFCLTRAYRILSDKLTERNTPLFRILFIFICLELWRNRVPPEFVAWPIWQEVHWWDVIYELTGKLSPRSINKLSENWFPTFAKTLMQEVDRVSGTESLQEKLKSSFNFTWSWINTAIVRDYLDAIMRQSKKQIIQSPPSASNHPQDPQSPSLP